MDYIEYDKNMDKSQLKELNIVVGEAAQIEHGVVLHSGSCILGQSKLCAGVVIGNNCVIENSTILNGCFVKSSYIENSTIGKNTSVGPFTHVRDNSQIGDNCRIGNFVEIKNSTIGENSNMAHLTYVGDAVVGKNCNLGCGVVFCNFDGKDKHKCVVGDNVFVGSNCNLIAPVIVEDGAFIAAGSTINKTVLKNDFAIARARQENKQNFNNPYIERLKNKKLID